MIRRIRKGRSPFAPDHEHLHHILLRAGFTVRQTVSLIIGLSLMIGLIGLGAHYSGVTEYVMFYGFMVLSILYLIGIFVLSRVKTGSVAVAQESTDSVSCAPNERCSEEIA